MSATEIIEELQRLPDAEQTRVLEFLQRTVRETRSSGPQVRYASDEEFDKAADHVLREHADLFRRLAQ
jgi:hypothetical protein